MKRTKFCVFCLKNLASAWTGHVKSDKGKEELLAGWCKFHIRISEEGFVGHWNEKMGQLIK